MNTTSHPNKTPTNLNICVLDWLKRLKCSGCTETFKTLGDMEDVKTTRAQEDGAEVKKHYDTILKSMLFFKLLQMHLKVMPIHINTSNWKLTLLHQLCLERFWWECGTVVALLPAGSPVGFARRGAARTRPQSLLQAVLPAAGVPRSPRYPYPAPVPPDSKTRAVCLLHMVICTSFVFSISVSKVTVTPSRLSDTSSCHYYNTESFFANLSWFYRSKCGIFVENIYHFHDYLGKSVTWYTYIRIYSFSITGTIFR